MEWQQLERTFSEGRDRERVRERERETEREGELGYGEGLRRGREAFSE